MLKFIFKFKFIPNYLKNNKFFNLKVDSINFSIYKKYIPPIQILILTIV